MKRVEDIEKEYEEYKLKSNYVISAEDFAAFIEIGIDEIDEQTAAILNEIKINCKDERNAKIRNLFFGLFRIEEEDYYGEDNKILEELLDFISKYKEYYRKLSSIVTKENFQELTRLVDFACEYYNKHIDYFEYKRDILEYSYKGIMYSENRVNLIKEFDEFFTKKIAQYESGKKVVKNKKIW